MLFNLYTYLFNTFYKFLFITLIQSIKISFKTEILLYFFLSTSISIGFTQKDFIRIKYSKYIERKTIATVTNSLMDKSSWSFLNKVILIV